MKRIALLSTCVAVFIYGCAKSEDTAAKGSESGSPPATRVAYSGVQSIFVKNCMPCHNAQNAKDGVVLMNYDTVMGSKNRSVVKPGDPDNSLIIHAVHGSHDVKRMPFGKDPLPEADIQKLEAWIKDGAKNE